MATIALGIPGFAWAARPETIPAVRSYQARPGADFHLRTNPRIVLGKGAGSLRTTARIFARELKLVTGVDPRIVGRGRVRRGDIRINENRRRAGPVGRQGYRLGVAKALRIKGRSADGAFYGTRTALQMLVSGRSIARGLIVDRPTWFQRGLMVDAGRKYFTPRWFRQHLRELSWLKLNFIHLHLSDNEGFRIESKTHPEAVSERFLTKAQVRKIVRIAARRRIEMIPEIDMPGHMTQALSEHPELQLENVLGERQEDKLDITKPAARRFAKDLVAEYLPLFPGRYWHVGADEFLGIVPIPDLPFGDPGYAAYPRLGAYATERYGPTANPHDAVDGFVEEIRRLVERRGKTLRMWHDGLDVDNPGAVEIDPSVVVEWWIDLTGPTPQEVLDAGHRIVNGGWFPTYYVQGPLGSIRPDMETAYESWNPTIFQGPLVCNESAQGPADLVRRNESRHLGTKLHIWNDFPEAQTEEEIAQAVSMRLRVLAQAGWDSPAPSPRYPGFLALADKVGHAPGFDEVTTPPSANDGRDCGS